MSYYQVNLASSTTTVRDAFRKLAHIEIGEDPDILIVALSDIELQKTLRDIQLRAAVDDSDTQFPTELRSIDPSLVIDGKTVKERFTELLLGT